jgi:PAS domain S-box-containing protein
MKPSTRLSGQPDEVTGHSIFDLAGGAWNAPKLRMFLEDVLPRNSFFSDLEVTRDFPHIGRRTMLLNARRLNQNSDTAQMVLLGIEDVSERQDVDGASAALAAIVNSSDDAIIGKDLNGVIRSWNKGAERLFGYTAQEAIGQPIAMLIPTERLSEEPKILERLKRGERVDHFETVRVRKDGLRVEISLTISPIKDATGRVTGASKIARDITDRKRAEEALRASGRASASFPTRCRKSSGPRGPTVTSTTTTGDGTNTPASPRATGRKAGSPSCIPRTCSDASRLTSGAFVTADLTKSNTVSRIAFAAAIAGSWAVRCR